MAMVGRKKTMKATLSILPLVLSEKPSHSMSVRTCAPLSRAYALPSMNSAPKTIVVTSSAQIVGSENT